MEYPYPEFTRGSLERMLAFLPAFESGEFRGALDEYMGSGGNPTRVTELATAVYRSGFVLPFDWGRWNWRDALAHADAADMRTLRKLMTAFVRGDRFSGGTMPRLCADGSVHRVLRRVSVLRADAAT